MPHSHALEMHVKRRAEKLDRYFERITACHVVLDAAYKHHRHGKRYRISISIAVPGGTVTVLRRGAADPDSEGAYASVDEAFTDAERRLRDWSQKLHEHDRDRTSASLPTSALASRQLS